MLHKILSSLSNRDLWKRVAALSLNTLHTSSDISSNVAYEDFLNSVMLYYHSTGQQAFFQKLKDEILEVSKILGRRLSKDNMYFAFIESLPSSDEYNDMDLILIEQGNGEYKRASEVFKGEPWMQGKENMQKEYFLITNVHERDLVYIALEKVLYECEERFLLDISAINCSKITKLKINKIKQELLYKQYYCNSLDLIPNEIVASIIGESDIHAVVTKFKNFQGKDGSSINTDSVIKFMKQFLLVTNDEQVLKSLFNGIILILRNATYVNREKFKSIASELFEKIKKYTGERIHLIQVGGSRDSSASWSYYFNDLPERLDTMSIENALQIGADEALVFFDDGAYSGNQIISIFQEYMGISECERTTNEHHVDALSEENKERLRNAKIILAYLFFNEQAKEKITNALLELGIKNVHILSVVSLKQKLFERDDIFPDDESKSLLKSTLAEIGQSILFTSKTDSDGNLKNRWDKKA